MSVFDKTDSAPIVRRRLCAVTLLAVALFALGTPIAGTEEEPNAGFRSSLEREWGPAVQKIEALAKAIPEEKYGWRPAEGVRSVSQVVMHIAHGNFLFADALGTARPDDLPEDLETITDKARALEVLRQSFDQVTAACEQAVAGDLDREVRYFVTARGAVLRTLVHANEHLGQLIAYARSNEVVPPWSR